MPQAGEIRVCEIVTPCTDAELRKMRDTIYPAHGPNQVQSDESWNCVKHKWRADEAWLRAQFQKVKQK